MKIIHISTWEKGGAARSALRLHGALLRLGHDSTVLMIEKVPSDSKFTSFHQPFENAATDQTQSFREFQSWYIEHNRTELSNTFFSLNEPGLDLSQAAEVQQADLIHLHWVSGLISPGSIGALQKLGKPIFWTLHDQRPFTGGCHFSAGCLKFQTDCHGCPQLAYDPYLLTKAQLHDAAALAKFQEIHVCSPSQWLATLAESSTLFSGKKVTVIPYGINTELFKPEDKPAARSALDLPQDATLLLFNADNANEKRKGFSYLMAALKLCCEHGKIQKLVSAKKLGLVCLGHPSPQLEQLGIPVHALGYIDSDVKVVQAYNAADLFVLPSLEDNLPNTVMEAMSCGVPVAAFAAGGIPEMVTNGQSGLLAPTGRADALAANLVELISNVSIRNQFGQNAREEVLTRFSLDKQGEAYQALYQAVLDSTPAPILSPTSGEISLAQTGPEVTRIVVGSSPRPLQSHLHAQATRITNLQKERDAHVATLHQQLSYIDTLKKENEEVRQQLEAKRHEIQRQQKMLKKIPVKVLRALKLI